MPMAITSGFPIQIASHIDRHLHPFTTSLASKTLGGSTASKRTISPSCRCWQIPRQPFLPTPSTSLTGPPWWSCRYEEIISDPSDGGMFHNSFTHDTCQPVHHPLFHILRIHLWVVAHVLQNLAAPQRIGAQIPHLHPRIHPLKCQDAIATAVCICGTDRRAQPAGEVRPRNMTTRSPSREFHLDVCRKSQS